jgi:prepilin-type N-terminal cleavage/methylation domain-containing protein/prepilin-type processing-associated H-X9-DG protein
MHDDLHRIAASTRQGNRGMMSIPLRNQRVTRVRGAFTLIELLVVVSIISLLIGILLPTLGSAVTEARTTVCGANQRGLAQGLSFWSIENKDAIPGVNTSWSVVNRSGDPVSYMNQNSAAPVQNWDWMSPALAGEDLPQNRHQRFLTLLERYRCPENRAPTTGPIFGQNGSNEMREFVDRSATEIYASSYLMSAYFQTTGGATVNAGSFPNEYIAEYGALYSNPVTVLRSYKPRLSSIGNPGSKSSLADGFRYFDDTTGRTNIDGEYAPRFYGSFAHSTPTFGGSREYVIGKSYSYRHNGRLSSAFFDGHVGRISEEESRDPGYWFPSGSTFTGDEAHPDAFKYYESGDTIN